ncbi:hypothetical protein HanRHA438_Chr02g0049431 [Helianthus annuus]|nr:hypothetical protein HanRHA438_Chr02g0049431 [Helianthus annuus]
MFSVLHLDGLPFKDLVPFWLGDFDLLCLLLLLFLLQPPPTGTFLSAPPRVQ